MVTKAMVSPKTAAPSTASKTKSPIIQRNDASLIQRAQADPSSLTSAEVLHLQSRLGNQAIMRLLDPAAAPTAPQNVIQRDPDDDDEPLLGASHVASDEYEGDEDEAEDADYVDKKSKLEEIATKLKTYYDMHKNYKKYEQYLSKKGWSLFKRAWDLGNKVIGWIGKVDPSGITKIVAEVSKAIRLIAGYIEEAVALGDAALREQVTPLLSHDMNFQTVKEALQEAFTVEKAVKTLVDVVTG